MSFSDYLRGFGAQNSAPACTGGDRIYAIGDVHGRLDLFKRLIKQLEKDAGGRPSHSTRIVLLGDLIDRGPESRELLQLVQSIQRANPARVVVLCGNHEDMLLASADGDAGAQRLWLENGGVATLQSYQLSPAKLMDLSPDQRGLAIRQAVGSSTIDWLRALPASYRSGDYFFCHAGVRPGIALNKQPRQDLMWIRKEFIESNRAHGAVVVHGHSEKDEVEICLNRINVDTAAYRTGELTAVGLEGPFRWFVSTARTFLHRSDLDQALGNKG